MLWVVVCCLLVAEVASGTQPDGAWANPWSSALKACDSIIKGLRSLQKGITVKRMQFLMNSLHQLPFKIVGLDKLEVSTSERDSNTVQYLLKRTTRPIANKLYRNQNLQSEYKNGLGFLIRAFQGYHNFRCLQALYSSSGSLQEYNIPLDLMCSRLKGTSGQKNSRVFSTDKICRNVRHCSGVTTPHPYGDPKGSNVQEACTEENQCDVEKALPMMGALLWYKTSAYIAQSLCYNSLRQPLKTVIDTELQEIKAMTRLVMAYASTLGWELFFQEAVERRAYSSLDTALSLVEEYEKSFQFSPVACFEIQAEDACIFSDINKEYQSIRKVQKYRLGPTKTRNLRLYARINHVKMIELKREALQHSDLLGNIRSVDQNLGSAANSVKNYFHILAEYDQGIADQDVLFLAGKLEEFEKKSNQLSAKIQRDVQNAMIAMQANLNFDVVQKLVVLTAEIGKHANPLKVMFGGVDADDIYEKSVEVAEAINRVTHGAVLLNTFSAVYTDMADLARKFKNNADQISNLRTMVDAIKSNSVETIGIDADNFIQAYGGYSPKVDRHMLAKNDALWAAYKASTCNLLFGAEGLPASIGQGVAGGMLLCEKLEGSLTEFASLRENIFDFQFDLVDSVARVVRGNIAKKLSAEIKVPNSVLKGSTLMLGYFMTHHRLQSEASLYCDKLEYRNQGEKIEVCSPGNGLFSPSDLDDLIAYNPDTTYHLDERFVYIPTKPQFMGDTGFISLLRLAEGSTVTFRLPGNLTWLRQYNWLSSGETKAPFVESFKLYLPHDNYGGRQYSKTWVKLTSIAGSAVSHTSDIVYNLPLEHSHYISVYSEGYNPSRCPSGKEITNPYSLCNNLPNICDTGIRVPGKSLMPTILSTWKLTYRKESPTNTIVWDVPNSATNLLLIGKVRFRFLPELSSKRGMLRQTDTPTVGCCTENNYRLRWNDKICVPCPSRPESPTSSVMKLGGLFCAKGSEEVAGNPIEYPNAIASDLSHGDIKLNALK